MAVLGQWAGWPYSSNIHANVAVTYDSLTWSQPVISNPVQYVAAVPAHGGSGQTLWVGERLGG